MKKLSLSILMLSIGLCACGHESITGPSTVVASNRVESSNTVLEVKHPTPSPTVSPTATSTATAKPTATITPVSDGPWPTPTASATAPGIWPPTVAGTYAPDTLKQLSPMPCMLPSTGGYVNLAFVVSKGPMLVSVTWFNAEKTVISNVTIASFDAEKTYSVKVYYNTPKPVWVQVTGVVGNVTYVTDTCAVN